MKKIINRKGSVRIFTVLLVLMLAVTLTFVFGACGKTKKDPATTPGNTVTPPESGESDDPGLVTIEDAYRSPSSVSVDASGNMYVSDATACAVTKLDAAGKEISSRQFKGSVQRVLVSGDSVYALVGGLAGELVVMDTNLAVKKTIEVGHTPTDIVVEGQVAYVANRFDYTVSVVDLASGKTISTIEAGREPVAMVMAGNDLYVANMLTSAAATDEVVASTVTVIDTAKNTVKKTITLTNGASSVHGLAVSPDGNTVFATHLVGRYTYPTTQLDRGWVNSNAFSVIDTKTYDSYAILLDELENGAANPWDIAVSEDGNTLYISLSGTQEIMTVNMKNLLTYVDSQIEGGKSIIGGKEEIVNYVNFLSMLSGIQNRQTRYALSGNGARDIELVGNKLYVAQYFTGTIDVLDFTEKDVTTTTVAVGTQLENTNERIGEMLWYDARFCYQQWESCASCHPEGRSDGMNWDEGGDGWGTPKNTRTMMFAHRTPPAMATGFVDYAELNVAESLHFVYYNASIGEDLITAVDDYLKSLQPVDSPYLNRDGSLTEAAERGKILFESAGCAACHPAPLYSDMELHKSPYIGGDGTWEDREMATPSLVEVWRSYPWNYYGGETSMENLIRKFAPNLKDNEVADLAEFVLSIGVVNEDLGVEQVIATDKDGETKLFNKVKPGADIYTLTVRCQTVSVSDATVTMKLYGADGKEITSFSQKTGKLVYNQLCKIELKDFKVPADVKKGSYLEITITAGDGSSLATACRLNCEVE